MNIEKNEHWFQQFKLGANTLKVLYHVNHKLDNNELLGQIFANAWAVKTG